jgi:hypothetical protein
MKNKKITRFYLSIVLQLSLVTAALLTAFLQSAFAADEKIFIHSELIEKNLSFNFYNRTQAYSCAYVQIETLALLKTMGAIDVQVHCFGGLPYSSNYQVNARFTAFFETSSEKSTHIAELKDVKLSFVQYCELRSNILKNILPLLDIRDYEGSDTCSIKSKEVFGYQLKTLFNSNN